MLEKRRAFEWRLPFQPSDVRLPQWLKTQKALTVATPFLTLEALWLPEVEPCSGILSFVSAGLTCHRSLTRDFPTARVQRLLVQNLS